MELKIDIVRIENLTIVSVHHFELRMLLEAEEKLIANKKQASSVYIRSYKLQL